MLNKDLLQMETKDVYAKVTEKVNTFKSENPNAEIISLGIGDVSKPIVKPIIDAMHKAVMICQIWIPSKAMVDIMVMIFKEVIL